MTNDSNQAKSPLEAARPEQYQDLEGVTLKKLAFALWFAENKDKMLKALIVLLLLVSLASWGFTIYGFGYYYIFGMDEDEALARQIAEAPGISHDYVSSIAAQPLRSGAVQIMDTANGKYDLAVLLENPNSRHWASLSYAFLVDGQMTASATGFILPGESKRLLLLGQELKGRPSGAELVLESVSWERISAKTIPDWEAFKNQYLAIEISDKKFIPARSSGLSEKLSLSQLAFTATNKSSYNYLRAGFDVFIYSGSALLGVGQFFIDGFRSGDSRTITANFLGQFARADRIEVSPNINILDQNNFLRFNSPAALPNHPVGE